MKKIIITMLGAALVGVLSVLFIMSETAPDKKYSLNEEAEKQEISVRVLRFGHNIPEQSAMHQAAMRFADLIDSKSQGQLKIEVYPAQQLGNDHQMVEMARTGELDIILTPTAKMSVPVPALQYADLPFLFPARDDAYKMLDGQPGQILLNKLRQIDLIGVTFWENGFKQFTANRPVKQPEDFTGLKIRTMKSRIIMEQFKAFGAIPIPIDFYSTRQALLDGVVDGQENPLIAIVSMGFHEVQSDLTLSNHAYLPYILSISKKVYDTLPAEMQTLLLETARDVTPWERLETQRREKRLLQIIQQAGVQIHTLTNSERQRFAEQTKQIVDQFEPLIGADVIAITEEYLLKKYRLADRSDTDKPIVIAIDADLSMDARISGLSIKRGAQLAVEKINAEGGVLGRKLALIVRDNKGVPGKGLKNLDDFIALPSVVAVIGGKHGSVVSSEIISAQNAGMIFFSPWSSVAEITDNGYAKSYIFRVSANDRLSGAFIVKHALEKGKYPAILYENSVWGRGNLDAMTKQLSRQGVKFHYQEIINRGDSNVSGALKRALKSGADVLLMIVKPMEGGQLLKSMAQQENTIPIVSHWGIIGGDFYKNNRRALAKVDLTFFQTSSFLKQPNSIAQQVAKRYIERYGLDSVRHIKAPAGVAQAYDSVQLIARAIKKAGSTQRNAVRDALEQLAAFTGAVKNYTPAFTAEQHDALNEDDYYMARFDQDGAIVPEKR